MNLLKKSFGLTVILYLGVCLLFCLESLPSCNPFLISSCGLTTLNDDPSNTQFNPVGGEGGISTSTSFFYSMKQLNQFELASVVDYQNNSMYAAWQALDNEDYTRQDIRFGVRYSYRFFRLGIGYKVLYDNIPGYGSEKDDRLNAGLRLKYHNSTLDLGSENKLSFADNEECSSGDFSFNFGQKIDANLALAFGINVAETENTNYKLGCNFNISQNFRVIAAWESEPGRFGIGTVFSIKWLNLAYALQTHQELEWTHSIGISAMFP